MNKLTWMTATAALALLGTASAWADGKPTAEITGFAGYRMGGQFDVNDSTTGDENSVDLQDSGSWGVDIGIYRDATSFYELLYSQQSSDLDSGDPTIKRADVKVEYFQFGGTIMYPYDDNWFIPYLSLTIGATRLDVQGAGSQIGHAVFRQPRRRRAYPDQREFLDDGRAARLPDRGRLGQRVPVRGHRRQRQLPDPVLRQRLFPGRGADRLHRHVLIPTRAAQTSTRSIPPSFARRT